MPDHGTDARPVASAPAADVAVRPIVLTDLDDTLFQTARKDDPGRDAVVAATDRAGNPLSFMAPHQWALFCWLNATARLVPVTGRNIAAFRRVLLPFAGPAVCSHGGVVLTPDGTPCPVWAAHVTAIARAGEAAMAAFVDRALASGEDVRARIIRDGDLPLYVSVKHNHGDSAALARLADEVLARVPDGWTPHLNDNNMALIPKGISKKGAAVHLLETYLKPDARTPIITLGDSLSDLPFMTLGHVAGFSGASQIARALAAVCAADRFIPPAGGR